MEILKAEVTIPTNDIHLNGILQVPKNAMGIVIFAHGSGSGRFSERNQFVASVLNEANIATLLFDLLTMEEEAVDDVTREHRFNIQLLSNRLIAATDWILQQDITLKLPIGYFGASTGGGAALSAAAQEQNIIKAVVSRGGRVDLAGSSLTHLTVPTLLIVGGNDEIVIELNQSAMKQMSCITELEIIPGATHLFEEPGTLDEVSQLARDWFFKYFQLV